MYKKKVKYVDDFQSAKYYDTLPYFSGEVYDYLYSPTIGMNKNSIIADVGCGTGRLAIDFLKHGSIVYGIEPDYNMRIICSEKCSRFKNRFKLIDGTDENLNIGDASVDFIVVSQAFHRFDTVKFKKECSRVLKDNGKIIIIWYRIDYNDVIIADMLHSVKENYKNYVSRYEIDEVSGAKEEEIANNKSAQNFFEKKPTMKEIWSKAILNKDEFINLGLSLSLFPITHAMNTVTKVFDDASFNKNKYIKDLNNIFNKYKSGNKIELKFRVQIHSQN